MVRFMSFYGAMGVCGACLKQTANIKLL